MCKIAADNFHQKAHNQISDKTRLPATRCEYFEYLLFLSHDGHLREKANLPPGF